MFTCPVSPDTLGIIAINPPYNWNNNPFQTNNTFTLNNRTGEMKYTATSTGSNIRTNALTLRINEYRNGVLIGSVYRDMQVYIFSCGGGASPGGGSTWLPNYEFKKYIVPGGESLGSVWAKAGQPIHLVYTATSDDKESLIILTNNHDTIFSNSTFYYIGNKSNNVEGHFFWTPGKDDTGHYNLVTLITDSACRPPGIFLVFMHTTSIVVSLGTDEIAGTAALKIYPNPNNGIFRLSLPEQDKNTAWRVDVVNIYGQKVYTDDSYTNGENIDLSTLPAGTYITMAIKDYIAYRGIVIVK
jgi:hypothetical protein